MGYFCKFENKNQLYLILLLFIYFVMHLFILVFIVTSVRIPAELLHRHTEHTKLIPVRVVRLLYPQRVPSDPPLPDCAVHPPCPDRAHTKQPEMVHQQLRALAILDTAIARQKGYPQRVSFQEFIRR